MLTPDAEFAFVLTEDPTTGSLTGGLTQASSGDLALVSGTDRLAQDVALEFLTAVGTNPFLPTQGSAANLLIGRVLKDPQATYSALVDQVEQQLSGRHADDLTAGRRTKAAALDHFRDLVIDTASTLGTVLVTYTMVSAAGVGTTQTLGFASGGTP